MQHREPLEGLTVSGSVKEGFGLRRPREPPHPDRRSDPTLEAQVSDYTLSFLPAARRKQTLHSNTSSCQTLTARSETDMT